MTLTTKNPMAATSTAHSQRFCTPRLPSVAPSERIIHSPFSYLFRRWLKPGLRLYGSLPARPTRGTPLGQPEQDQVVDQVQVTHRQPAPHAQSGQCFPNPHRDHRQPEPSQVVGSARGTQVRRLGANQRDQQRQDEYGRKGETQPPLL